MEKLKVMLDFGPKQVKVGELALLEKCIYFKYATSFLEGPWDISPYHLKRSAQIQECSTSLFSGLFGVFDDSLPDGWGKLLVDRKLLASGVSLEDINPLLRLSLVGQTGPGALIYQPAEEDLVQNASFSALEEMEIEVKKVLADEPSDFLDDLFAMGGSSGGARPKANVGFNPLTEELFLGATKMPLHFEPWIVKFRSTSDVSDMAQVEYAYYLMAKEAGLDMSDSRLFEGQSGSYFFGTKRFDRTIGNRIHLHSAAAMLQDNYRLSSLDYGHLMECAFHLEKDVAAIEKILRLAAYNVFSENRDDHSKNVSFLMDAEGNWTLAPPYDLTFSQSAHGHHSMSIAGESKNPGRTHLLQLANTFGLKNANEILDQVEVSISKWTDFADQARVSKASRTRMGKALARRR